MDDFSSISPLLMRQLVRLKINFESDQLPMADLLKIMKRVDASYDEFRSRISTLEKAVKNSSSEISDYLDKLREADAQNKQRTQDIINLLENIHLGILTIKADGKVHQEYSRFLEEILDTKKIADESAIALIFGQGDVTSDRISQMESIIEFSLGSNAYVFETNEKSLARMFHRTDSNGFVKTLEVDWNPIVNSDDLVEKIVVTLRDVTEIQDLREAARQHKFTLDILGQIVDVSIKTFKKFAQQMQNYLAANFELLEKEPLDIVAINRNLHTIKGSARVLSLRYISDCIHEAENRIKVASVPSPGPEFLDIIRAELNKAASLLNEYQKVADSQFHNGQNHGEDLTEFMNCIQDEIKKWSLGRDAHAVCLEIKNAFNRLGTETLSECLKDLVGGLPSLAKELDKPIPLLEIDDQGYRFKAEAARTIADMIGHAVRNALDHGIEEPSIRTRQGKRPEGRISLKLNRTDDSLILRICDDGQGLNLEAIQKKAESLGLLHSTDATAQQIADLIFCHELSTARHINQISGRGIGMDAMRGLAKEVGAKVEIELHNHHSRNAINFDLVFSFPRSILVEDSHIETLKAG